MLYRFLILHLAGLAVFAVGWSPVALVALGLGYLIRYFGVAAVYHRYFSHRAYRTSRGFQLLLALVGTTSGQRGPLWWAATHRHHHRHSDTARDVHSPHHGSLFRSHLGWLLEPGSLATDYALVPDWARYPELVWLNERAPLGFLLGLLVPFAAGELLALAAPELGCDGWQLLVWGGVLATLLCSHVVLAINSLNHLWGSRPYRTKDRSVNVSWLAPLMLGEHLHNSHHRFPSSHTAALAPGEWDLVGAALRALGALGLVWELKRPSPERVARARASAARAPQVS